MQDARRQFLIAGELSLLMQRWCPVVAPEPPAVAGMVRAFLGAYDALADCLEACGLDRSTPLDDPTIPPHLGHASFALGQLDSAVGTLVEASGARLGPAEEPFQNVGPRCPVSDADLTHVAAYLSDNLVQGASERPLQDWLLAATATLRAQASSCAVSYGGSP